MNQFQESILRQALGPNYDLFYGQRRSPLDDQMPVDPAVQESLIRRLGRGSMSTLQYVGESLDKPMAAVRGVLAGRPEELANLIPFSDALGITSSEGLFGDNGALGGLGLQVTDDENTVYGRDLLEAWGAEKNKEGFGGKGSWADADWKDAGLDLAGFAIDLIGPPVAAGGKALTAAGKAAQAAGVLDDAARAAKFATNTSRSAVRAGTVDDAIKALKPVDQADALRRLQTAAAAKGTNAADLLNQRMGYDVAIRNPFTGNAVAGISGVIDPIAGLANKVPLAAPVLQGLNRQFNAGAGGYSIGELQSRVGPLQQAARRRADELARGSVAEIGSRADAVRPILEQLGGGDFTTGFYRAVELPDADLLGMGLTQQQLAAINPFRTAYRTAADQQLAGAQSLGVRSSALDDPGVEYATRRVLGKFPDAPTAGQQNSGIDPGNLFRSEYLKGIPGGTGALRELFKQTAGINDPQLLRQAVEPLVGPNRADDVAKFLAGIDPASREAGIYIDPLKNLEARLLGGNKAIVNADVITDLLGNQSLTSLGDQSRQQTVMQLLSRLGLDQRRVAENVLQRQGAQVIDDAAVNQFLSKKISSQLVDDLARAEAVPLNRQPGLMGDAIRGFDSATAWWKGMQTGIWPAFHVRNRASAKVREGLSGGGNNPLPFADPFTGIASRLSRGQTLTPEQVASVSQIPDVAGIMQSQGVAPEDALRQLLYRVMPNRSQGQSLEDIAQAVQRTGSGIQSADEVLGLDMVGGAGGREGYRGLWGELQAARQQPDSTWLNFLKLRGVSQENPAARFIPGIVGDRVGGYIEDMNRVAPLLKRLSQGANPSQAAADVLRSQVDYSPQAYTAFEREVMSRLMPFYKFGRGNIPYLVQEIAQNPYGKTGTLYRAPLALNRMIGDDNEILPSHIADSLAIPLGLNPDGSRRYLTKLGLMEEDLIGFGNPSEPVQGTVAEVLSRLHPAIKAPIELVTGKSMFQRGMDGQADLDQMDPLLGRLMRNVQDIATGQRSRQPVQLPQSLEILAANSPFSRALSLGRQVTDKRKLGGELIPADVLIANALTGLGITDVSPQRLDAELQTLIGQAYQGLGGREFQTSYIPKETLARMNPAELAEVQRLRALEKMLRDRRKARAMGM